MELGIVADGGPDVGFGHLVRTGALARAFLGRGWEVTYVSWTPEAVSEVAPESVSVGAVDSPAAATVRAFDVAVVDTYRVGTDEQRDLRRSVERLGLVEDRDTRVCCDVLVNGNVYAPALDYEYLGAEPEWCLGTDYLLLRAPFRERARRDPPWRPDPERGLVIMGGSDINDATPGAVRAFDGLDLAVDVVVGPGFTNHEAIAAAAEATDAAVTVHERPGNLPDLMFEADLAVSATGSTVYELLATGTPTVGIPQADNQVPIAEDLQHRGALVWADKGKLRECIEAVATDPDRRRSLREHGRKLVDGRGPERVYDRLAEA